MFLLTKRQCKFMKMLTNTILTGTCAVLPGEGQFRKAIQLEAKVSQKKLRAGQTASMSSKISGEAIQDPIPENELDHMILEEVVGRGVNLCVVDLGLLEALSPCILHDCVQMAHPRRVQVMEVISLSALRKKGRELDLRILAMARRR